jgi:hypothetical protein
VELTKVADMPGYPTRKLLLGGPDTRTNAAILLHALRSIQHEQQVEGFGVRSESGGCFDDTESDGL